MARIMLSVLQFRINARYVEANPPFISIEMDHSDSGGWCGWLGGLMGLVCVRVPSRAGCYVSLPGWAVPQPRL